MTILGDDVVALNHHMHRVIIMRATLDIEDEVLAAVKKVRKKWYLRTNISTMMGGCKSRGSLWIL